MGHTIGVGIFLTPAELIGGLASPALTLAVWVGCAALVLAGALTFGELASRYPRSGGLYVYLRHAWGERVAFLYGWQCLLVMDPGITAALALGGAEYAGILWPEAAGREPWIAIATIWVLAGLAMSGLTITARVASALTAGKILLLVGIVVAVFSAGAGSWAHFPPGLTRPVSAPPLGGAVAAALVSVFFSFGGFWEASRLAGEVRDPARVVPRALVAGVLCVTALYVATTAAFIYLVPAEGVTTAARLLQRMNDGLPGGLGAPTIAVAVLLSVTVSALALLLMAPRLYVEMSRDGLFPSALAVTHPRTGAPVRATLVLAVLASVFAGTATLQQIVALFMVTTLGFVALAAAGVIVLRRLHRLPPPFLLPGYPWTVAAFVLLIAAVTALVVVNMPAQAATGVVLMLLGVPAYRLARRRPEPSGT